MSLSEEQISLRERVVILEIENRYFKENLHEALEALHKTNNAVMKLQSTLDALTNQGKGMQMLVKAFLALGGVGWLAGMVAFVQQVLQARS